MNYGYYQNELYHHGRLNQKWGVRNGPPYPLSRQTVQKAYGKKKRGGILGYLQERKAKKEAEKKKAAEAEAEKRKREEEEAKARRAADKERVLREGSATEIYEYRNELTNQELSNAINRIKWRNELSSLASSEVEDGWKQVDMVMKKFGKVKDWTKTAAEFYKAFNDILTTYEKSHKNND